MPFHGPCDVDWICDATAGAHVAKHRDWFSTYTEYRSLARTPIDKYPLRVHGIGDVELEVRTNTTGNDGQAFHSVILRDVLYIPTCETNIVSEIHLGVQGWSYGANPYVTDEHGRKLLLDDPTALHKLWLVGQRRGQTSIDVELDYDIGVKWPMEEREKWKAHWRENIIFGLLPDASATADSTGTATADTSRKRKRLDNSEEASAVWIKERFNGEWEFLRDCNLSFDDHGDRERGHEILTAAKEEETKKKLTQSELEAYIAEQRNTYSRMMDAPKYTRFERAWLHEHFGHNGEIGLLREHGWNLSEPRDVEKGLQVARHMMRKYGNEAKRGG